MHRLPGYSDYKYQDKCRPFSIWAATKDKVTQTQPRTISVACLPVHIFGPSTFQHSFGRAHNAYLHMKPIGI